jgi:DNA-binding response OmpR family regulator
MPSVLIVDDDPLICEVITECLQDWTGTTVTCAHDGEQAAEALQATRFDFALIDVLLPSMSGFQVAEIAVSHDTPVLLLSGHPLAARRMADFGWPGLEKPFSLATLQTESRRVIAEAQDNVARVRASAALMKSSTAALSLELRRSQQIMEDVTRQARERKGGLLS